MTTFSGSTDLPAEVALCLSYRGSYTGLNEYDHVNHLRPRSHVRNRTYLGPLDISVMSQDATTKEVSISSGYRTDVTLAAKQFFGSNAGQELNGSNWQWYTFSRKVWNGVPVTTVWADNEFDTQRRRGLRTTIRTTQTL